MLQQLSNQPELYQREVNRFVKFAIVGAVGTVIDFTLLNIFAILFDYDKMLLLLGNTISTGTAIVNNFSWNRLWTFPESRSRKKRTQLVQFTLVSLVGLTLNAIILYFLYTPLIDPFGKTWALNIAKTIATGVVLFWNFGANRLWTYRGLSGEG